jgi:predicted PurR-regulated permease PerM
MFFGIIVGFMLFPLIFLLSAILFPKFAGLVLVYITEPFAYHNEKNDEI